MRHMFLSLQRQMAWPVNAAALVILCYVAARWTWVLFEPKAAVLSPLSEAATQSRAGEVAHVFGGGVPKQAHLPPGLRLDGIFTPGKDEPGAAIFIEAGKGSRVVLMKGEVSPGFYLEQIARDHVVLNHDGARVELKLEKIAPELDFNAK